MNSIALGSGHSSLLKKHISSFCVARSDGLLISATVNFQHTAWARTAVFVACGSSYSIVAWFRRNCLYNHRQEPHGPGLRPPRRPAPRQPLQACRARRQAGRASWRTLFYATYDAPGPRHSSAPKVFYAPIRCGKSHLLFGNYVNALKNIDIFPGTVSAKFCFRSIRVLRAKDKEWRQIHRVNSR